MLVEQAGSKAVAVHADVSRRADVDAMVAATVERFGAARRPLQQRRGADVGAARRLHRGRLGPHDRDEPRRRSSGRAAPRSRTSLDGDGGSIINTASVLGLIGSEGYAAYGAAKAGLVALTQQIATEYGPTVRANVIAPGSIDTPRFRKVLAEMDDGDELRRGLPREHPAAAGSAPPRTSPAIALFLASDLSAYTSGAVIPADGGLAALR